MTFKQFSSSVLTVAVVLSVLVMGSRITGCTKDSAIGPVPSSTPMVNLAVSFSNSGTTGLEKGMGVLFTDSLHIDSAVVVFSRIKFLQHADSVSVDSGEGEEEHDEHDSDEHDESISFKGPFVVHIYDTVAIDLGSKELPAGVYDGITFKVHRLKHGERHEDCYKHRHHYADLDDSTLDNI